MGAGIVLGIIAALIAGGVANEVMKDPNAAFGPAILVGGAVFWFFKNQEDKANEARDKPTEFLVNVGMAEAFGFVKQVLTESHMGDTWWQIRSIDPEAGKILAITSWKEYIGDQVGEATRQITLNASFYPGTENKTMLVFQWDVVSSFNRNQANQVIDQFTAAVKNGLGA
ncbi:MAG TPA: hypothetical protein PL000_16620 [Anaerolineales bacterium]|jgi:hypothetical protein|nr:hypothetical protein [Anaerolineales bacterium]